MNLVSSRHYAPQIDRFPLWSSEPPELAPSDYYLFPNLKKHLTGWRKFSSIEEAASAADGWFAAERKEFFLDVLKKLEQRSHKCVELRGEYAQ
jgi:hypothetical protein